MDLSNMIGPFFFLIIGLSVFIVAFTMFVNFVRGLIVIVASLALGYYFIIATPTDRRSLDSYASKVFSFSGNNDYVGEIKRIKNSLEKKAMDNINKL